MLTGCTWGTLHKSLHQLQLSVTPLQSGNHYSTLAQVGTTWSVQPTDQLILHQNPSTPAGELKMPSKGHFSRSQTLEVGPLNGSMFPQWSVNKSCTGGMPLHSRGISGSPGTSSSFGGIFWCSRMSAPLSFLASAQGTKHLGCDLKGSTSAYSSPSMVIYTTRLCDGLASI